MNKDDVTYESKYGEPLGTNKDEPASISVRMDNNVEVMRIENDGRVFWLRDGKNKPLVQAKIDNDIAQAFALCVVELTGLDTSAIIKNIQEKGYNKITKQAKQEGKNARG